MGSWPISSLCTGIGELADARHLDGHHVAGLPAGRCPAGVPVEMMSPGSSVITRVTNAISWSIGKISSRVEED